MFLKSATVYKIGNFDWHKLEELVQYVPIQDKSRITQSAGFAPFEKVGENAIYFYVENPSAPLQSVALQFIIDEKAPAAFAIQRSLEKRIKVAEEQESRVLGRKERSELRDDVYMKLLETTPVKTTKLTVFIVPNNDHFFLMVSGSKTHQQIMLRSLIRSLGKLETSTLHFEEFTYGLTTRLENELADRAEVEHALTFHPYAAGGKVTLVKGKQTIKFDLNDDGVKDSTLYDALRSGWQVSAMRLQDESENTFVVDRSFQLKSIQWADVELSEQDDVASDEVEDVYHEFMVLAQIRCAQIRKWVNDFREMMNAPEATLVEQFPEKEEPKSGEVVQVDPDRSDLI